MWEWRNGLRVAPSCNRQCESDQFASLKRAEDLPSCLRGDDKQRDGDDINVSGFPDCAFDADAGFEFLDSVAMPDQDSVASFRAWLLRSAGSLLLGDAISCRHFLAADRRLGARFCSLPQDFQFFFR